MRAILNDLFEHKTLSRKEATEVLTNIAKGMYTEVEISAFITVYLMRSITVAELSGFRDALLNLCIRVDLSDFETLDVCGTGGDGRDTFNISTLTTFVLAGAGAKVAKHGNYAVSSSCGSSNILEYFGYKFSTDMDKLKHEIDRAGVCFLHAPLFNPAMKNVAPVRKALKIKTFFNMLGPMVNPSFPSYQLIGVYSLELMRLYNYLYQQICIPYALVHSLDGYDEISLTGPFRYVMNGVETMQTPGGFGFATTSAESLAGGKDVAESAGLFLRILEGKGTPSQLEVVEANTQLALMCRYPAKSAAECRQMAHESLVGGAALRAMKTLMEMQQ